MPTLRAIHIISSPERAKEIVTRWREREAANGVVEPCSFIWEPVPWSCRAEASQGYFFFFGLHQGMCDLLTGLLPTQCLDLVCEAAAMVDILTPNHGEAACLLDVPATGEKEGIETIARQLQEKINGNNNSTTAVVIRSGKLGALVAVKEKKGIQCTWVPAYHTAEQETVTSSQIQDVTGAGNAFCTFDFISAAFLSKSHTCIFLLFSRWRVLCRMG